jgi:hypothetical protein
MPDIIHVAYNNTYGHLIGVRKCNNHITHVADSMLPMKHVQF